MTTAASKMFTFYLNLLSPESKYVWNKIIVKQTESDPWKAQGECLASHCTTASCITFSLRFPSKLLSKKSITSQMYLRSPSASTYASLYVVQSNSMPTSHRYHASTTAPMQMPAPSPRTFCSWRLSQGLMCCVCASEVQSRMIFMGHQRSSCHVPVVRSFFIL